MNSVNSLKLTHGTKQESLRYYPRRLMGQKSGLEDSYLKLSEEDLLEGDSKHIGYLGVIDQLTINEENKLKKKVQTLTIQNREQEEYRRQIDAQLTEIANYLGLKD